MSFLSIEQRKAALAQLDKHIALLDADAAALRRRLGEINQYRFLQAAGRERVRQTCEGALDADELETIDSVSGERLRYGIAHYPVKIESGPKVTVQGVW